MLFNSWAFVFGFLPVVLVGYYGLRSHGLPTAAKVWLALASLFFYGWWNASYLIILITSTIFNFYIAQAISASGGRARTRLTVFAIVANLAVLAYFKYLGFLVDNLNAVFGLPIVVTAIALPLGISFITFQKIGYLSDIHGGQPAERSPVNFLLFVSFFPQLIAGPIVHHRQVLPQFAKARIGGPDPIDMCVGLTLFSIGLFKKTMFADPIGAHANLVFDAAARGMALSPTEAWLGALAYTFQLYFDFSGYSDMAIGLARMFGIRLPINFASPYQSCSIIDFWRRWHVTLSRFLRDYVYIPLGGNRHGPIRRFVNVYVVMLVGGIWHGAGWTFILWGGLHGLYLLVNHAWRMLPLPVIFRGAFFSPFAWLLTFVAVVIGWVLFRAPSLTVAVSILKQMFWFNPSAAIATIRPDVFGDIATGLGLIALLFAVTILAPNSQTILRHYEPALDWKEHMSGPSWANPWLAWSPNIFWMLLTGCALASSVLRFSNVSEFIYFNF